MNLRALFFIFSFLLGGLLADIQAQVKTVGGQEVQKILLNGKEYYLHIIQKGEGLYRISVNYGVSQQEILDANEDISESLKVGQILRIPVISGRNTSEGELDKSRTFFYHTVEKGQTAYFVSRKYDVPLEVIYANNPGTENGLTVGAILRIPVERKVAEPTEPTEPIKPKEASKYSFYTIRPGDTLYSLARQYSVTVETIVDSNPALRAGVLQLEPKSVFPKLIWPLTPFRKPTPPSALFKVESFCTIPSCPVKPFIPLADSIRYLWMSCVLPIPVFLRTTLKWVTCCVFQRRKWR
ncbi:LysM-repeat proteins and domains [Geofilum rubicundum JCM 15548]|uniref:LysM-repeat proteins and domains n=1 Tax=Geofilum rubicundum JCM 15548 TaxID=1236989 RepID=A0A0E9M355_9BACT|nr:LysM peptidoglycan-binding domain-containing protein [Geofilum rubicundum]GAO31908.1 LysM-repeat proteins and domains [Geofilum rubicundum JCM 15548]